MSTRDEEETRPAVGEPVPHLSKRRLVITTAIMVAITALTFGPAIYGRSIALLFVPVWLSLTVGIVIISMWFARYILIAERARDSEPGASASHQ